MGVTTCHCRQAKWWHTTVCNHVQAQRSSPPYTPPITITFVTPLRWLLVLIVPLLGRYPRSDSLFISCWQVPPGAFKGNNYSSIRVDGWYCVSSAKQDLDEEVRDTQWWSYSRRVRLQWPLDKGAGISNKIRVWVGRLCPRKHRADCKRHFALCYTLRNGVLWLYHVTLLRTRDFLEFLNLDLRSVELD